MKFSTLDWSIVFGFFVISLLIGIAVSKKAGKNSSEFFLSGRNMPWWLLGISMVATTFAADTPNLVTDIVRKGGVAGNWVWWAFLITGMFTVFVYAKLWRRSGIMTDLEFYELRYSGKPAAFLRGFRAIYLGLILNVLIMANVFLAGIKLGGVILDISPVTTVVVVSLITVLYSTLGGLKGVILTDFFQFGLAMVGSVWAAIVIIHLPQVGSLSNLFAHANVAEKLRFFPDFHNPAEYIPLFVIPIAVQWWSVWYPGAEPGGGGYIAQRMLAAKNENHAMGATLLFNIAHYALRPWPWILIALASLIVFPDVASLKAAFPNMAENIVKDDMAYPAMLSFLPAGLLGLVIASLIAALMSTISTHLNWGSSYLVNDVYNRFVKRDASEKELVKMGRISTVLSMILAGFVALKLENAKQAFDILVLMGAGTGLIFLLRWFWWRINAYSEIAAMIISFVVAVAFQFEWITLGGIPGYYKLILTVLITSVGWLVVTVLTRPTNHHTLVNFYKKIRPSKHGWYFVLRRALKNGEITEAEVITGKFPLQLLAVFIATATVYLALFATGFWIYGEITKALITTGLTVVGTFLIFKIWGKISQ